MHSSIGYEEKEAGNPYLDNNFKFKVLKECDKNQGSDAQEMPDFCRRLPAGANQIVPQTHKTWFDRQR